MQIMKPITCAGKAAILITLSASLQTWAQDAVKKDTSPQKPADATATQLLNDANKTLRQSIHDLATAYENPALSDRQRDEAGNALALERTAYNDIAAATAPGGQKLTVRGGSVYLTAFDNQFSVDPASGKSATLALSKPITGLYLQNLVGPNGNPMDDMPLPLSTPWEVIFHFRDKNGYRDYNRTMTVCSNATFEDCVNQSPTSQLLLVDDTKGDFTPHTAIEYIIGYDRKDGDCGAAKLCNHIGAITVNINGTKQEYNCPLSLGDVKCNVYFYEQLP